MGEIKRSVGRPKSSTRVQVTIKMDQDLRDWTADKKRSDMINRLLRKEKEKAKRK